MGVLRIPLPLHMWREALAGGGAQIATAVQPATSSFPHQLEGFLKLCFPPPLRATANKQQHCITSSVTTKNTAIVAGGMGRWTSKKDLGGGKLYKLKVRGG